MKGYKVFNPDFTCNGYQYAENSEYVFDGSEIKICSKGFHFCVKASHCFNYYSFTPENIVCEVEALGEIQTHTEDSKACTNHIKIGRRLSWAEVLVITNEGSHNTGHSNSGDSNSGDRNSGDRNSGNWNSGDRNSGDSNSGYRNSGYRNSGDWNSGDSNSGDRNSGDSNSGYRNSGDWNSGNRNSGNWNSGNRNSGDSNSGYRNSGAFCTDKNPSVCLFDKPTNIKIKDWENHEALQIMRTHLEVTLWVHSSVMTDEEKKANPKHETTEGYLKSIPLKEAWANMWHNLSEAHKLVFTTLPNFDPIKFKEITGIDVELKQD
jgi:hypothetical protein